MQIPGVREFRVDPRYILNFIVFTGISWLIAALATGSLLLLKTALFQELWVWPIWDTGDFIVAFVMTICTMLVYNGHFSVEVKWLVHFRINPLSILWVLFVWVVLAYLTRSDPIFVLVTGMFAVSTSYVLSVLIAADGGKNNGGDMVIRLRWDEEENLSEEINSDQKEK